MPAVSVAVGERMSESDTLASTEPQTVSAILEEPGVNKLCLRLRFPVVLVLLLHCAGSLAKAQPKPSLRYVAKLTPSAMNHHPQSRFARHMDVDGNRVLVGSNDGAFLFEKLDASRESWVQLQFLDAPLGGYGFGSPVALYEDTAAIGDEGAYTAAQQAGGVDLFRSSFNQGPYAHIASVWPADAEIHDAFGSRVELGDGILFVGADNDNHNGVQSSGTVTLFAKAKDKPSAFVEVKKFAPSDLRGGHDFGDSMELDSNRLVVGASGNGANLGAVYVYERNAGGQDEWGQVAKLDQGTRFFGEEVAVDGDTILVSRLSRVVIPGSVSIYDYVVTSDSWELTKTLTAPHSEIGDEFGYAITIREDLAVVSRTNAFSMGAGYGEAFVFGRNQGGPNNWGRITTLTSPEPEGAEYFGSSVAIMDEFILVGSLGYNTPGFVYVFAIPEPTGPTVVALGILALSSRRMPKISKSANAVLT